MFFRNKFDDEFLFLADAQSPKGGSVNFNNRNYFFKFFENSGGSNQPDTVKVVPLLLFNRIHSSNVNDLNVEDYMMICESKSDTVVSCEYDEDYVSSHDDYVCDFGIHTLTGDFKI
ncbi:MAG: hypothetical protein BZ136_07565 [Methanosphaera sp. rholeuAM74]|nr:MAG: hypothetical protein BZ136_07565 [Methanosphaera sp. rholeuAM74]